MNSSANTVANGNTAIPTVQQICEPKCATLRPNCSRMWRHRMLRSKAGEASPIANRMMSPPALRIVIVSNAFRLCESARADSAAMMKAVSVPLIQNSSQPSCAGRASEPGGATFGAASGAATPSPSCGGR